MLNRKIETRAELHLHTRMSAFAGLDDASTFFKSVSKHGIHAIAVTDLGSVQSYREADKAAKKQGIKPIFGAEFFIERGEGAHRVVVLAKNHKGIQRIYDLVTLSQTDYRKEGIPFVPMGEMLSKHQDLLIGFVACDKGIAILLEQGLDRNVQELFSCFDYIEIAPPEVCSILLENKSEAYLQAFLTKIISIAGDLGIPVIASGDTCYLNEEDAFEAGALDPSRAMDPLRRKSIKEPIIKGRYLRPTKEMLESLSFLGEDIAYSLVIDTPNRLCDSIECPSPFEGEGKLVPLFEDADQRIAEICYQRLEGMFSRGYPSKYRMRLNKELKAIHSNGSASIFMTYHLLAEKAKADGRVTICRGNAGNSLVAYLLGITNLNPLKPYCYCPKCNSWEGYVWEYAGDSDVTSLRCPNCDEKLLVLGEDLPFELLFGLQGGRVPDIDMAFSHDYLPTVHQYLQELFGKDNVARVGALETLPQKSAMLRVQSYCKKQGKEPNDDALGLATNACMASKRLMGQHPCGFAVLPKGHQWNEFTPLEYPVGGDRSGFKITHLPWQDLGDCLYKFDFLGDASLSLLERLAAETGVDIDEACLDESAILGALYQSVLEGTSQKIPGYKGGRMRRIVSLTRPSSFKDWVKVQGLLHGTGVWKYYETLFASGEASLSDEIVTNREDLFLSLLSHNVKQKDAHGLMERVRTGLGLTNEMKALLEASGFSDSFVGACESIQYLFPKAHIVGFLRRDLKLLYFKLHFPEPYERIYHELFA